MGLRGNSAAPTLTSADTGRIDGLSGGTCHSSDFEEAYDRMIPFVAAGFKRVCKGQPMTCGEKRDEDER